MSRDIGHRPVASDDSSRATTILTVVAIVATVLMIGFWDAARLAVQSPSIWDAGFLVTCLALGVAWVGLLTLKAARSLSPFSTGRDSGRR